MAECATGQQEWSGAALNEILNRLGAKLFGEKTFRQKRLQSGRNYFVPSSGKKPIFLVSAIFSSFPPNKLVPFQKKLWKCNFWKKANPANPKNDKSQRNLPFRPKKKKIFHRKSWPPFFIQSLEINCLAFEIYCLRCHEHGSLTSAGANPTKCWKIQLQVTLPQEKSLSAPNPLLFFWRNLLPVAVKHDF